MIFTLIARYTNTTEFEAIQTGVAERSFLMARSLGIPLAGAALVLSANKTSDQTEQYGFALRAGGDQLLLFSIAALIVGFGLVAWSELRSAAQK